MAEVDSGHWRVWAMMLLAEIGDLGRFGSKEALCSAAGLVPRVRESAGKAARGGITRQGSSALRWIMVEAAQAAMGVRQRPSVIMNGCCAKNIDVARVALARKLPIAVYALLHDGVEFEEEKFATRQGESVSPKPSLLFESDAQMERRSRTNLMCLEHE